MENTGLFNAEGAALSIDDVMAVLPTAMINRVEVIDENGRSYTNWKPTNRTELQVQDNGRTLKVFVSQNTMEAQKRLLDEHLVEDDLKDIAYKKLMDIWKTGTHVITSVVDTEVKWGRSGKMLLVDDKVVFDTSDSEYGPVVIDLQILTSALEKHEVATRL